MARIPFIYREAVTLTNSGSGTISIPVSADEQLEIYEIRQKSEQAFDVIGINTSSEKRYSNATDSNPMDGQFIADIADEYNGIMSFREPIVLEGNTDFQVAVKDTSGSGGEVELVFNCVRVTR